MFWMFTVIGASLITSFFVLRNSRTLPDVSYLHGRKVFLQMDPGLPYIFSDLYTFRGNWKDVAKEFMDKESVSGYVRQPTLHNRPERSALIFRGKDIFDPNFVSICIVQGRTTGKYFEFDGDFAIADHDPEWSTLELTAEDPVPHWLRRIVSWPYLG